MARRQRRMKPRARQRLQIPRVIRANRFSGGDAPDLKSGRSPDNRWIGQRIDDPEVEISKYAAALGVESAGPIGTVGDLLPAIEAGLKVVESGKPYVLNVYVKKGYAVPPPAREA